MIICEKKKRESSNETFYRYAIGDTKVWFTQHDDGSIYRVNVAEDNLLSGIEIYVKMQGVRYYPEYTYILTDGNTFYTDDEIDAYIEKLEYAKRISRRIMNIFEKPEHKDKLKNAVS